MVLKLHLLVWQEMCGGVLHLFVMSFFACSTANVCSELIEPPSHGSVNASGQLAMGDVAGYECDEDYVLFGAATRTCMASKQFSNKIPVCGSMSMFFKYAMFAISVLSLLLQMHWVFVAMQPHPQKPHAWVG